MSGTNVSKQKELPGKLHAPSVSTRLANCNSAKYLKLDSSARGCPASTLVLGLLALGRVGAGRAPVVAFSDSPWPLVSDELVADSIRVLARSVLVKVVRLVVVAVVPGSARASRSSRMLPIEILGPRLIGVAGFVVAGRRRSPLPVRTRGTKYVVWAREIGKHHQCTGTGATAHVIHTAQLHNVGKICVDVLINVLQVDKNQSVHELPWLGDVAVKVVVDDLMLPVARTRGDAVPSAVQRVVNTWRASMNSPNVRG